MDPEAVRELIAAMGAPASGFLRGLALALAPVFGAIADLMTPAIWWAFGYQAGERGLPRDWEMPDDWHRGYLYGMLARVKRWPPSAAPPTST